MQSVGLRSDQEPGGTYKRQVAVSYEKEGKTNEKQNNIISFIVFSDYAIV